MKPLTDEIKFDLDYEYQESVADYKELQKLIKKLRRQKHGRDKSRSQKSRRNYQR